MILTKNGMDYNFLINLPIELFKIALDINNEIALEEAGSYSGSSEQEPKSIGQQFPGLFKI